MHAAYRAKHDVMLESVRVMVHYVIELVGGVSLKVRRVFHRSFIEV